MRTPTRSPSRHILTLASFLGLVFWCSGITLADENVPIVPVQAADESAPVAEQSSESLEKTSLPEASSSAIDSDTVQFAFNGVPWREVVGWIAEEAGLALHVGDVPPGSFTYTDPEPFTHQQAIDRINLFLISEGFTLVRSGNLLTVINLADPRSVQQLDRLADLVLIDQIDARPSHDVVKVIFPLGDIDANDAITELSALKLMATPTVLSKTNQIIITDTVAKIKNIKAVLDAFEPSGMDSDVVIKGFPLKHVKAEDVLLVARPHLGLATGEMIGIDVSVSTDLEGKILYVTGLEDKVKLIEGIVASIDQPQQHLEANDEPTELRSHAIEGGNLETVYNVLQTLLSGKTVRLSMDKSAGTVVALATPKIQNEIASTVAQLQASSAEFEVIPLKTVDPYFAVSLLEQMLNLPDALDRPSKTGEVPPKIDADPANRRLFVRGKRHEIEHIKKMITGLESTSVQSSSDDLRVLTLKGKFAEQAVETAAKFWRSPNPIILYPNSHAHETQSLERIPGSEPEPTTLPSKTPEVQSPKQSPLQPRQLTTTVASESPAIRCQVTDRGLLIQSDDTEALSRFEEHIRAITGPLDAIASPPVVFYLQHTKPNDALRLLGELLDGDESIRNQSGGLVNGYVSSGSSAAFASSLVKSDEGTTTMMAGSITIVADTRLNRLIAQGTTADIERVEGYLKIIDKDQSIAAIETYGTSKVIELEHTKAIEVAEAIREAYAGRVTTSKPDRDAQGQTAVDLAKKAAEEKRAAILKTTTTEPPSDLEPKMTVAVHEASNSLIVTAPKQLFAEVEKLAKLIDSRGEQAIEVIVPANSEVFGAVLHQVILGEGSIDRSRSSSRTKTDR